jgi:hypothetical protein
MSEQESETSAEPRGIGDGEPGRKPPMTMAHE